MLKVFCNIKNQFYIKNRSIVFKIVKYIFYKIELYILFSKIKEIKMDSKNVSAKTVYEKFIKNTDKNIYIHIFNKFIECLNKKEDNRIEYCLDILKQSEPYEPTVYTYTNVINSCNKSVNGTGKIAIQLLEDMIKKGLEPNNITYGCCINVQSKNGTCKIAMNILNKMIEHNIKPYKQQLNALIKCQSLLSDGSSEQVFYILELFEKYNIIPDVKTIHLSLETFKNKKDITANKTMKILDVIDKYNIKPDRIVFTTLLDCQSKCKESNCKNSIIILNKIFKYGLTPNNFHINSALNSGAAMKKIELDDIFTILSISKKSKFKASNYTLSALLRCCEKLKNKEMAKKWFIEYSKKIDLNYFTKKVLGNIFKKEELQILLKHHNDNTLDTLIQNNSSSKFTPKFIEQSSEINCIEEKIEHEIILINPRRISFIQNYTRLPLGPSSNNFDNINGVRIIPKY